MTHKKNRLTLFKSQAVRKDERNESVQNPRFLQIRLEFLHDVENIGRGRILNVPMDGTWILSHKTALAMRTRQRQAKVAYQNLHSTTTCGALLNVNSF